MDSCEFVESASRWIESKVKESNSSGVVVGLSGGLDSSVVMALAGRAAGIESLGLIMPCHSSPRDEEHARAAARVLGVKTILFPLEKAYEALIDAAPPNEDFLAAANVKARLRMIASYYVANCRNYLVAGTGNRSELVAGYFTKYGDGGADILPIGGLLKMQVKELAFELGVPEEIIEKPPSAGLWNGQTDEEEMGIDYETLDEIIAAFDAGREPEAPEESINLVRALMQKATHKLNQPPIFRP